MRGRHEAGEARALAVADQIDGRSAADSLRSEPPVRRPGVAEPIETGEEGQSSGRRFRSEEEGRVRIGNNSSYLPLCAAPELSISHRRTKKRNRHCMRPAETV